MSEAKSYKDRLSGIELLKIIAILLIVTSHVAQTVLSNPRVLQTIDLSHGTENLQYLALVIFRHFGPWGNCIFFSCSAWFLLSSKKCDGHKWFFMFFEIWLVSVTILICSIFYIRDEISAKYIGMSFLPTFFGNNSYLTLYLLFYPIHPILNDMINRMDKTALFRASSVLFLLYFCLSLLGGSFFSSRLILWITMYFAIAYCKTHLSACFDRVSFDILVLAGSLVGLLALIGVTNYAHLRFLAVGKMLHWAANDNPFLFAASYSMLQLARKSRRKSAAINYISGLSLLIYVFHENILLRTYVRPKIINYIYTHFGYDRIALWTVCLALLIFVVSVLAAAFYREVFQKYVKAASGILYERFRRCWLAVEQKLVSY